MRTERERSACSLADLLAEWEPIEEVFPPIEELPFESVELDFDIDPATEQAFREFLDFLSRCNSSPAQGTVPAEETGFGPYEKKGKEEHE
jgi:hypothetical protein